MLKMGMKRAAVVHGSDLGEAAIHGSTKVAGSAMGIKEYTLEPKDFGVDVHPIEEGGFQRKTVQLSPTFLLAKEHKHN